MSGKETERERPKRRDRSQFRERYREPDRQTDRDNLRKYHRQNVGHSVYDRMYIIDNNSDTET